MNLFTASAQPPVIPVLRQAQDRPGCTRAGIQRLAALLAILLLPAAPASAEPLGKLFLTPERRAALERQRQLNIREAEAQVVEVGASLSVSGVVRRSSGRTTTWVNNTPQDDMSAATGVRVEIDRTNPARTTVVAGEESPASLKVGESINRATRETTSGVGDGRITVKRGAANKAK